MSKYYFISYHQPKLHKTDIEFKSKAISGHPFDYIGSINRHTNLHYTINLISFQEISEVEYEKFIDWEVKNA